MNGYDSIHSDKIISINVSIIMLTETGNDPEFFREHSEVFLLEAERLIEERKWVLAAIAIHHHCEYLLKYKSIQLKGSYVNTHSIKMLIRSMKDDNERVMQLLKEHSYVLRINRIEHAYTLSKLSQTRYTRDVLTPLLVFTRDVFDNIVGGLTPS